MLPTGAGDYLAPRERTVTVGNYFKHLIRYGNGMFARHPRFRYFALNTEMRWRALQTGRVYIKQHPKDARLSLDELRDMVGHEGDQLSSRVLHYASSLRGTRQYWFQQRNRLVSMVDTPGLSSPTVQQTVSGPNWPASSVSTALRPGVLLYQRTRPLLIGSSTNASASSWMPPM